MSRIGKSLLLLTLLAPSTAAEAQSDESPAAQQYKALLEEFEETGGARSFAGRFLEFAQEHRQDPAAVDALLWVVKNLRGRADADQALLAIQQHHAQSEKLDSKCLDIANARSAAAEPLLRAVVDRHPNRAVQAQACYYLAALLEAEASIFEQLRAQPELRPRVIQYYGKDYGEHLASLTSPELDRKREQLYQQMQTAFAEAEVQDIALSAVAERMLFKLRHLSVGKVAPEIEGEDIAAKPFKLSDYRGKIVMLTFWGHW